MGNVIATLNIKEESVSIAIEEVKLEDWKVQVYDLLIAAILESLYKKIPPQTAVTLCEGVIVGSMLA